MAHGDVRDADERVGRLAWLIGADDHPGLIGLHKVRQALGRLDLADQVDLVEGLARRGPYLSEDDERAEMVEPRSPGRPEFGHPFVAFAAVTRDRCKQQQV